MRIDYLSYASVDEIPVLPTLPAIAHFQTNERFYSKWEGEWFYVLATQIKAKTLQEEPDCPPWYVMREDELTQKADKRLTAFVMNKSRVLRKRDSAWRMVKRGNRALLCYDWNNTHTYLDKRRKRR